MTLIRIGIASLCISACWLTGCNGTSKRGPNTTKFADMSDSDVRNRIAASVPIGSSAETVTTAMETIGFRCAETLNGTYSYQEAGTNKRVEIPDQHYLRCTRKETDGLVDTITIVGFLMKDEKVHETIVSRAYSGP